MAQLFAIALYISIFCFWVNGIAVCLKYHEYFWAVFNFVCFPIGALVGAYNFFF